MHIVINNQIGFTTSDPRDARARRLYCTDVVKMIEAPVLHVNGDDPEAVVLARRWRSDTARVPQGRGRSTSSASASSATTRQDTPALTQPLMYKKIAQHPARRASSMPTSWSRRACPADGPDDEFVKPSAQPDAGQATVDPVLTNFKSKYAHRLGALPRQEVDRRRYDTRYSR